MSDINVTAGTGGTINVSTGTVVGPLPELQIAAGNGITVSTSGGVSTISANVAGFSIPANLADLANVEGSPTAGQVLAWNGTSWAPADDQTGGSSDVSNLADLSDVSANSPSSGQTLTWDGSQWAAANVPAGTTVNGLSGGVTLVGGNNINVSADGQNITIGTIGQASISNLTDLVDVNATMSPASGQALVWDGSEWTADSVAALVSNVATLDLGAGRILYSNVYDTLNDLPAAADYHGMFAHVHNVDGLGTGAAFYAHAGNWVQLADNADLPASYVRAVNGLSGAVTIAGDSGITVSQVGNQLTLRSTQTFTTLNGESGSLTLTAGDNIEVLSQDGIIRVSATNHSTVNNISGDVSVVAGQNINVTTSGQNIVISGEQGGLQWVTPAPSSSSDPGNAGDMAYSGNYLFLHNGVQWNRVLLSPFGTTYRILTEAGDTVLTEAWDYLASDNAPRVTWSQLGENIDGEAAFDLFGWSVSISSDGGRIAAGGSRNDAAGADAGHVRVYDWSGSAWTQVGADIDGEAAGDFSGISVSLSGDGSRIAIGAHRNDGGGADAGHVRVYEWSGSAWTQVGADIDGEAASDSSGGSVSLSSDGSRLAIGAVSNDGTANQAGHVRVYDWSGSAWAQVGADIDGEAANDFSGYSVAISGDGTHVAIGAIYNDANISSSDPSGSNAGHVRVYAWNGSSWVQVGGDIDGQTASELLGWAVAISSDGGRVAVGSNADVVRVYDWSGTAWVQAGSDIAGEAAGDAFGRAVSISGDGNRLAIGAPTNGGAGNYAGHVRAYDWSGSDWAQAGVDIDGEAIAESTGSAVAISSDGTRIVFGANGADGTDGTQTSAGRVRVYEAQ